MEVKKGGRVKVWGGKGGREGGRDHLFCYDYVEVNVGVDKVSILISSHSTLDAHQTVLLRRKNH